MVTEGDVEEARARLEKVRQRIATAARAAGRDPADVTLVGVSKRQPVPRIAAAVAAGLTHLGESFAQEARDKRAALREALAELGVAEPRWHFVGQLQRNKARLVAPDFDVVESVDRASLGLELDRRAKAAGRMLEALVQVNLSGEAQKGGVDPDGLPGLLRALAPLTHLEVTGLMTVPAASEDPEHARPSFAALRALRDRLSSTPEGGTLRHLSMGMSGDFEVAIGEGATIVRIGTALFGPRRATP